MPTIIMHCQPDWMPTGTNRKRLSDRPLTTFLMATWLTEKLAGIINVVDLRMGEDTALSSTTVWADFVPDVRTGDQCGRSTHGDPSARD
jgi:hypothetical protein